LPKMALCLLIANTQSKKYPAAKDRAKGYTQ
jgi:hypothetical protein